MDTTKYTLLCPGELPVERSARLSARPSVAELDALIRPLLNGADLERVNVFWEGRYTDMFVDTMSVQIGLDRNDAATEIYRNNWLTHQDPKADPETLPAVYGPAVLFARRVWW